MRPAYIIGAGVAVAAAVAWFAFKGSKNAEVKASLERIYGRKVPKLAPGTKWNPHTGATSLDTVTTGPGRF